MGSALLLGRLCAAGRMEVGIETIGFWRKPNKVVYQKWRVRDLEMVEFWSLHLEFPDSPEAAPTTHDLLLEIGSDA